MMGPGFGLGGWPQGAMGRGAKGSVMTKMMFALMDANGDGKLSLEEWQAAQERIFKAMDANKDGSVTLEEMENFFRGAGRRFPPRE
jgi:Ca2+-binding EF-hand superfamily protein